MNRWTPLTLLALFAFVSTVVNVIWHLSLTAILGGALACVMAYWIVGGCARRGEPVARRILRH